MSHPLAEYVRILARGKNGSRSMTFAEAEQVMQGMLSGNALPEQVGAIFMLLRVKEETAEELGGFAAAINRLWPQQIEADLVWPSYAGKRRQPFWCFLSMLLLTRLGKRIIAHGTEAHTEGRLYLHEVFEAFSLPVIRDLNELSHSQPLMYLPCATLNPVLQQWLGLKAILGVRSPINTVMKTIAPAGIPSVQGIFHPNYAQVHAGAAALNQRDCIVIKGEGGEFEVNPERDCRALLSFDGQPHQLTVPKLASHIADKAGDISIRWLCDLWNGDVSNEYAEQAVLNTAALALCAAEKSTDFNAAQTRCRQAWQQRLDNALRLNLSQ